MQPISYDENRPSTPQLIPYLRANPELLAILLDMWRKPDRRYNRVAIGLELEKRLDHRLCRRGTIAKAMRYLDDTSPDKLIGDLI